MLRCNLRRVVMPTVGGMCIGIVIVNFVVHWKQFGYGLDELDINKAVDKVDSTVDQNSNNNHTNSIYNRTKDKLNGKDYGKYVNLLTTTEKSRSVPVTQIQFTLNQNQKIYNSSDVLYASVPKQIPDIHEPVIIKNRFINAKQDIIRPDGSMFNTSETIWPTYDVNGTFIGDDRILTQLRHRPQPPSTQSRRRKVKIIYIPSGLGDLPAGRAKFRTDRCSVDRCSLTSDSRYEYTADMRILQADAYYDVPPKKPRGQIWLLWLLEAPLNTISFPNLKHLVNWTATYRSDSTLVTPYEKYVPYRYVVDDDIDLDNLTNVTSLTSMTSALLADIDIKTGGNHNDVRDDRERDKLLGHESIKSRNTKIRTNYAAGKTRMIAWFVSNCGANNRRWEYMQELRRNVPVDVYGDCSGGYQCARTDQKACDNLLSRDYKFYLSFENSNCQYYITEKFFRNALWNNVVPIVMGARRADYRAAAPPHSYIHVENYPSARELANYLILLNATDTLYNEYFEWKSTPGRFINTRFWCRLCAMLNSDVTNHVTWYDDVDSWWRSDDTCTNTRWDDPAGLKASASDMHKSDIPVAKPKA